MNVDALKDLMYRIADDDLVIAHRHSEWTGLGPILEEDIAFSSIAQDKLGHAQALYGLLHDLGEAPPDNTAFMRDASALRCCHFVELPNGEYDVSLMRHFLFDAAELFRYHALTQSSYQPLAKLAAKVTGEIKYHVYHAQTWVTQLGAQGNEESHRRMQQALDVCWPYALGMFEISAFENDIIADGMFIGEDALKGQWLEFVAETLREATLAIPENSLAITGGRTGVHTTHLQPLLDEMTEVFRSDPTAEW